MSVYKVTATQTYYVEANTAEEAKMYFINDDDEHIEIGFTEVTDVEQEADE